MKTKFKVVKMKLLFAIILVGLLVSPADAANNQLIGFDQMVDDINGTAYRLLYKLEGDTYELSFNQPGSYQLNLIPEELFKVVKTGDSTFLVTINNPKGMYEKHQKEPFKIKWLINEIVDF